ncbi:MAG: glycosyltransferase family 4 protein [Anaerolineae bacterium]|nr:glycosyltransferase family 4 protein [Anaerolineae bacterium]
MNIVMFSMTPLFRDKSMGGAQKQLKKIAIHLGKLGHQITILCTYRDDAPPMFHWHENVLITAVYRFKQPFPEPYATPTYNIAAAIQTTGDSLADADVFYSHDGGLIFPFVSQDIPTVVSLRSVIFSETLQSGYLFDGDALILPSQHTANVWLHTKGRFFPEFKQRVHVIHNGLDFDVYKATEPKSILNVIPIKPDEYSYILYPHRPEAPKGILQTIAVVDKLVHEYNLKNVRVLVPKWIDSGLSADVRQFYTDLEQKIAHQGLAENFIFHDWVSDSQMPEYYSLGDITFAIGNYVETFGNTPYESLACGTPVIAARVGPYREMLPEDVLVDYDDIEVTAKKAAHILKNKLPVSDETMNWLHDNFQQQAMVEAYADIILTAKKRGSMIYHFTPITQETRFILAPWCYISDHQIYHDFGGRYQLNSLTELIEKHPDGLTFADSNEEQVMAWYRDGYIVPLQGQDS